MRLSNKMRLNLQKLCRGLTLIFRSQFKYVFNHLAFCMADTLEQHVWRSLHFRSFFLVLWNRATEMRSTYKIICKELLFGPVLITVHCGRHWSKSLLACVVLCESRKKKIIKKNHQISFLSSDFPCAFLETLHCFSHLLPSCIELDEHNFYFFFFCVS